MTSDRKAMCTSTPRHYICVTSPGHSGCSLHRCFYEAGHDGNHENANGDTWT